MKDTYYYEMEDLEKIIALDREGNVTDIGVTESVVMFQKKVRKYNSKLKLTGNFLLISDRQRPLADELAKFLTDKTGANVLGVLSQVEELKNIELTVDYLIVVGLPFEDMCGEMIEALRFKHKFLRTVIFATLSLAVKLYVQTFQIHWKYDKKQSLEEFVFILKLLEDNCDNDFLDENYYENLAEKFKL